ncbi:isochorismatase family protein [Streptomyces sp. NPDC051561]|uniref:isochorismatase family protein n=1 Tax=Streptomyces sp. NPDC051561 TaxID=3365658 RepID=UPI0037B86C6F
MPSYEQLVEQLDPVSTVLLTVECQEGVVGKESAMPELAREMRESGALGNVARLVDAAHAAGVQVMHAVAERRADGRGANRNARLFRAAERLPVRQEVGSWAVRVAEPIVVAESDLVMPRLHGLSPVAGTGVDAVLRNLGCRSVVVVGVSANVAILNAVFDLVNLGYQVVVVADAIAGVPGEYTGMVVRHSLGLVAGVVGVEEVVRCWGEGSG